ncbi:hypothetical protein BYT27DRAFT_7307306 [Phlegmacium glaucopus]|nr:hypothetical protein BYT27DRAFT_7307306 [Phlegmacium glaucopus]
MPSQTVQLLNDYIMSMVFRKLFTPPERRTIDSICSKNLCLIWILSLQYLVLIILMVNTMFPRLETLI